MGRFIGPTRSMKVLFVCDVLIKSITCHYLFYLARTKYIYIQWQCDNIQDSTQHRNIQHHPTYQTNHPTNHPTNWEVGLGC